MGSLELLEVLGKEYNPDILRSAKDPKSAKEFSRDLDIPIATCYRRIQELTEAGLLEREGKVPVDQKRRSSVYRRNVDAIRVEFDEDSISVDIDEVSPIKYKLENVWRDLDD